MTSLKSGPVAREPLRQAMDKLYLADEESCAHKLLESLRLSRADNQKIQRRTENLVTNVRKKGEAAGGIEAFLREYNLSTEEGVVLMCLAEALLRIPDDGTVDRLIKDRLTSAHWEEHIGRSQSLFVNASTWGLMLTGRIIKQPENLDDAKSLFKSLVQQSGAPLIRKAIRQGMRIIAHQFVLGRTLDEAIARGDKLYTPDYSYSFDMLGEAAVTQTDADSYFDAYFNAIERVRELTQRSGKDIFTADSLSVKLSALHPRYAYRQQARLYKELLPRLMELVLHASQAGVGITIDAEEADTLNISLDLFSAIYLDPALKDWEGFGLVVQTYQKRAPAQIEWLKDLARRYNKRIPLRLVKGAYWDTEIKRAQEQGWTDYPVFTRKATTDLSYLVCAQQLLDAMECFYPQFASHNAHTITSIRHMAKGRGRYEFQRLHGMGESLYTCLKEDASFDTPCRLYAPVGSHEELLPYLVRRLLENGANTSFVNRIEDASIPLESITESPVETLIKSTPFRHTAIPRPPDLYAKQRKNSLGLNLDNRDELLQLYQEMGDCLSRSWRALPIINGIPLSDESKPVSNPADATIAAGEVIVANRHTVEMALTAGVHGTGPWASKSADFRADILTDAATRLEQHRGELVALCISEAGRIATDALAEVREAVDFCRYYAQLLRCEFASEKVFTGPTGEANSMTLHGRGLFVCISPWNFPIAIFTGQLAAALAAGNAVIAKPASQTPLVGMRIVQLFHAAGVPVDTLQYLPGSGSKLGQMLVGDRRVAGVAFTGSTDTARRINQTLAARPGPIIPLIAETGGQNAMIVDSSALPEQAVRDIVHSAFNSAGQRCSALRVLFLQEEIAPRILPMLMGAMDELVMGNPMELATDMGPVIDEPSCEALKAHISSMNKTGRLLHAGKLPDSCRNGSYFAPQLFEIDDLSILTQEVFGPILHVIRYRSNRLDQVIGSIKQTGYGLTLGIHSRVEETIRTIQQQLPVGNTYVNRNMIGAVVGVQPFGGEGLSGTGPKAGGPYTLLRYATERCVTVNTAAVGGNAGLLALDQ